MTDMTERIRQVMDYLGLSRIEFSKAIGMKNQTKFRRIMNEGKIPQPSDLERILFAFPQISSDWLFYGNGEMLKSVHPSQMEHKRGIGTIGHITGGVNSFHENGGKDMMIKEQGKEVTKMFEAMLSEIHGFHEISRRRDKHFERQDEYISGIVKHSYLRNRENMERIDKIIEQQNELIRIVAEQSRRTQDRADRLLDMLEKNIN